MIRRFAAPSLALLALAVYLSAVVVPCPEVALFDAAAISLGLGGEGDPQPPELRVACPCGCHHTPPATSVAGVHQLVPPANGEPVIPQSHCRIDGPRLIWETVDLQAPETVPKAHLRLS